MPHINADTMRWIQQSGDRLSRCLSMTPDEYARSTNDGQVPDYAKGHELALQFGALQVLASALLRDLRIAELYDDKIKVA